MPVVVKLLAIPQKETPALAQATEEIAIFSAENMIHTTMEHMVKAIDAWSFQVSTAHLH